MQLKVVKTEYEEMYGQILSLAQLIEIIDANFTQKSTPFQNDQLNLETNAENAERNENDQDDEDRELIFEEDNLLEYSVEKEIFMAENQDSSHIKTDIEQAEIDDADEQIEIDYDADDLIEYDDLNPHKCQFCCITFTNRLGLQHHQKTCKTPITAEQTCNICEQEFQTCSQLKIHQKKAHTSKVKCDMCDLVVVNDASLKRHVRAVHFKEKTFKCRICSKAFSTSSIRKSHEKTHQKNVDMEKYLCYYENGISTYSCPKCNENFQHSSHLKSHMEKNCYQPRKKRAYKYNCKFCDKQYVTKIKAAAHYFQTHKVKIENPQKFCFECNVEVEDYVNHIRIHTCQFSCRYCGSKFLTEETCQNHEISKHPDEKPESRPFKCQYCDTSFKSEHHLKSHTNSYHVEIIEKEYACDMCGSRFTMRALLNAHLRTHDKNSMIFECCVCPKRFKKLSNLKTHSIAVHQTEDIYNCGIESCQERFKLLKDLKLHRQLEHNMNFNVQKYFNT